MITYKTLYEYDNNNRLRIWYMEQENDNYRTVSGLQNGEKVISAWKVAKPKNIGRANATTGEEQAKSEIESQYTKRIKRGYSETIPDINAKPRFFDPMLACKYEDQKILFPVYSQPKLDGYRCLVKADGMWSRGHDQIVSSPHIFEELKPIFTHHPDVVFDGELYNHEFKADFNKLSSLISKKVNINPITLAEAASLVEYHIYDVYFGSDENFSLRSTALNLMFSRTDIQWNKIKNVSTEKVETQDRLDELYALYLEDGYEGQMVRINDIYEKKRSKFLIKRKNFEDDEFIVLDIQEGQGNWAGKAKRVVLQLKNGNTCESGIRGTQTYLAQVLINKDQYIGKPAKTRFQNYTPDGKLRMPVVIELDRGM
jgi:DNA ligase-1